MTPAKEKRVPALDGIRGVAISLVLIYHALFVFADFPLGSAAARVLAVTRLWWNGVDLFFVLSGFLIGGILLDAKTSPRYYQTFYTRRVFRILPLYLLILAAYWITASALPSFGEPLPGWSYVPMLQNIFIASTGAFGVAWLGVTWSLAIEEQFYLIAPTLIRSLSRGLLWRVVIGTILLAPFLRLALFYSLANGHIAAMVLVFTRADVLMLGVAIAMSVRDDQLLRWLRARSQWIYAVMLALGASIVVFTLKGWSLQSVQMVGVGYTLQGLFFAAVLLLVLLNPSGALSQAFTFPPLRFLGVRAYALYLFHVPLLYLSFLAAGYEFPRVSNYLEVSIALAALAAAVVLGALSWKYLERPLIDFGHRFSYDQRREPALPSSNSALLPSEEPSPTGI